MLSLLFVACLRLANGISLQETTLNALTSLKNGASITRNPASVSTSGPNYDIEVQTQDSYDLKISLNNSWGFHPSTNSTITLTLDGFTPFPNSDADFLFVFSVNNWQYFSFFLHLDTNNLKSRIYPSVIMEKNTQTVSEWISDTKTISQRWHRVSNDDQWIVLNEWREQALWPLRFVIYNKPLEGHSVFELYHDATSTLAVQYTFDAAFVPNEAIDIYILGDSKNEQYTISSTHITLTTSEETNAPTSLPTDVPTNTPTKLPTLNTIKSTANPVTQSSASSSTLATISSTVEIPTVPSIATLRPTSSTTTTTLRPTVKSTTASTTTTTTTTSSTSTKRPTTTSTTSTAAPTQRSTSQRSTTSSTRSRATTKRSTYSTLIAIAATTTKQLSINDTNSIQIFMADVETQRKNGYLVVFGIMVGCAVMAVLFQFCRIISHKRRSEKDIKEEDVAPAMMHHESMKSDNDKATEREMIKMDINDGDVNDDTFNGDDDDDDVDDDDIDKRDDMSSTQEKFEFAVHGRRTEFVHTKNDSEQTITSKFTAERYRKETDNTESVFYERVHRPFRYDYEGKYEETDAEVENTVVTQTLSVITGGRRFTNDGNPYFMGSPTINRYWNNHIKIESMPTVDDSEFVVPPEQSVSSFF